MFIDIGAANGAGGSEVEIRDLGGEVGMES